jgi:hypothetical protein
MLFLDVSNTNRTRIVQLDSGIKSRRRCARTSSTIAPIVDTVRAPPARRYHTFDWLLHYAKVANHFDLSIHSCKSLQAASLNFANKQEVYLIDAPPSHY